MNMVNSYMCFCDKSKGNKKGKVGKYDRKSTVFIPYSSSFSRQNKMKLTKHKIKNSPSCEPPFYVSLIYLICSSI